MTTPPPPDGYESWLDYAVDDIDSQSGVTIPFAQEGGDAARAELARLRRERDQQRALVRWCIGHFGDTDLRDADGRRLQSRLTESLERIGREAEG